MRPVCLPRRPAVAYLFLVRPYATQRLTCSLRLMKSRIVAFVFAALAISVGAADQPDPWQPVRFFIGRWKGTAEGEAGAGTVERRYEFILRDKFIQEHNTSTY